MPYIKKETDVAANAQAFPLQGSQYEYLPFDAMVQIAILADTGDSLEAEVFAGSDVIMEPGKLDSLALATPLTFPDDFSIQATVLGGQRLGISVRETGGLAATFRTAVMITRLR